MTDLRDQLRTTLGDAYTIERELEGGGMSRVIVAVEKALSRKVGDALGAGGALGAAARHPWLHAA